MATYIPDFNSVKMPVREASMRKAEFLAMLNANGYKSLGWLNGIDKSIDPEHFYGATLGWFNGRRNEEVFVNHSLKSYYMVDSSD